MSKAILPFVRYTLKANDGLSTLDKKKNIINQSSIVALLGKRNWGTISVKTGESGQASVRKQALKDISYLDIARVYYLNKQEKYYYRIGASKNKVISFEQSSVAYKNNILQIGSHYTIGLSANIANEQELMLITSIPNTINTWRYIPWSEWKNYLKYAKPMEKKATLTCNNEWDLGTYRIVGVTTSGGAIELDKRQLQELDDLREWLMTEAPETQGADSRDVLNYFKKTDTGTFETETPFWGLIIKTYQSDLFNNWINKERIEGANSIAEITKIDTSSGGFTIDQLVMSQKVYEMLNRIAVTSGTYEDWIEVNYNRKPKFNPTCPYYIGGYSDEIIFDEVVSNVASEGEPMGTLAGKGQLLNSAKGGHIKTNIEETAYIMGICSITPRVDYSQGNAWDDDIKTMDDIHKPALDRIGFQDLLSRQMCGEAELYINGSNSPTDISVGKVPAWINYMTSIDQCFGNFSAGHELDFMVLNREYSMNEQGEINSSTYIQPNEYYKIFAQNTLDNDPFWVQIAFRVKKRTTMSAKIMPKI